MGIHVEKVPPEEAPRIKSAERGRLPEDRSALISQLVTWTMKIKRKKTFSQIWQNCQSTLKCPPLQATLLFNRFCWTLLFGNRSIEYDDYAHSIESVEVVLVCVTVVFFNSAP